MNKIFQNYGLSITLAIFFIASWFGQLVFQWQEFAQMQKEHNQPVEVTQFIPELFSATFENWQSEFLQLFTMVVLTSFLSHKGSPESKDSEVDTRTRLERIEKLLKKKS